MLACKCILLSHPLPLYVCVSQINKKDTVACPICVCVSQIKKKKDFVACISQIKKRYSVLSSHPTSVRCDIEKGFITCSAALIVACSFGVGMCVFTYLISLPLYVYVFLK